MTLIVDKFHRYYYTRNVSVTVLLPAGIDEFALIR